MSVLGKIIVKCSTFQEMLVDQWTAGPLPPYLDLRTTRQLYLKGSDNILSDTILQIEHIVQPAVEAVRPSMTAVRAVN